MPKNLYISDLDGTLLNQNARLSSTTKNILNSCIQNGTQFSYATARSFQSASIVTAGLQTQLPVIIYNGAILFDTQKKEVISSVKFTKEEMTDLFSIFLKHKIFPLVYSFIQDKESVSWCKGTENDGVLHYLHSRKGDPRLHPVSTSSDLLEGDVFYFTCIGEKNALLPAYEELKEDIRFTKTFQQEIYRDEFWLECMPKTATKANAILKLKDLYDFEHIISFGDAINDIPMFEISDEAYAVANAVPELKKLATNIIDANTEDGVAHWLNAHWNFK